MTRELHKLGRRKNIFKTYCWIIYQNIFTFHCDEKFILHIIYIIDYIEVHQKTIFRFYISWGEKLLCCCVCFQRFIGKTLKWISHSVGELATKKMKLFHFKMFIIPIFTLSWGPSPVVSDFDWCWFPTLDEYVGLLVWCKQNAGSKFCSGRAFFPY